MVSSFKLNPYDPCVANMEIEGFQLTVTWHVDDRKVSHIDPFQVTRFAEYLASIYGEKLKTYGEQRKGA